MSTAAAATKPSGDSMKAAGAPAGSPDGRRVPRAMAGPCWESPAPGLGKQQGCAGDGVSGRQQGQGDWVKREGHVAKPCLAPGESNPLQPRTFHGRRSRGPGARAMLTTFIDTNVQGHILQWGARPRHGAGRPGRGSERPGRGGPRAPQSSVMLWVASGVPATQRGALWGVGVQGHRRHGQLQRLCTG